VRDDAERGGGDVQETVECMSAAYLIFAVLVVAWALLCLAAGYRDHAFIMLIVLAISVNAMIRLDAKK